MQTTDKTILITGGSSGLGLGLALRFQAAGNRVIVAGRRQHLLDQIVTEHPGIESLALDVADPSSILRAREIVGEKFPEVDVLINMAGIMQPEDLHSADFLETAEATITTNLLGTIRMVAAFIEFLQAKDEAVIMNVSSGLAFVPLAATPTYDATKSAVHGFTEALRVQLRDTSVEVLELIPPAVATSLMGQDQHEGGNAMPVDEYLDEVMEILSTRPDEKQVMVERVTMLRFAEVNGNYDEILEMLAGARH